MRSTYIGSRNGLPESVNSRIHTASWRPGEQTSLTWVAGLSTVTVPSTFTRAPPSAPTLTTPESEPSRVPGDWPSVTP
jgi:hypothetical protein